MEYNKEMEVEMLYTDSINELKDGIIPEISNKNLFYIIEEQGVGILENVSVREIQQRYANYMEEQRVLGLGEQFKSILPF